MDRRTENPRDNLVGQMHAQQGAFMTQWNQRHGGRFVFPYTPTHGSWLNQVELWFWVLSRRILRYAEFRSPAELVAAIERFIRQWNETEARGVVTHPSFSRRGASTACNGSPITARVRLARKRWGP